MENFYCYTFFTGESGSDLSSGTIAGVVVGIIVLVAVALVILAFVLRRRYVNSICDWNIINDQIINQPIA